MRVVDTTNESLLYDAFLRHGTIKECAGPDGSLEVEVHVPGAITGLFSVVASPCSGIAGTTGVGVSMAEGVTVHMSAQRANEPDCTVLSQGINAHVPVVTCLVQGDYANIVTAYDITVSIETNLPIGAGFGVSGATSLGTSLCLSRLAPRKSLPIHSAYGADVDTGGGYGDIVTQVHGGISLRRTPGLSGIVEHVPAHHHAIVAGSFGPLSTKRVLSEPDTVQRISTAGDICLARLSPDSRIDEVMASCYEFALQSGLMTSRVSAAATALSSSHAMHGSMVMLGETVFTLSRPDRVDNVLDILSSFDVSTLVSDIR